MKSKTNRFFKITIEPFGLLTYFNFLLRYNLIQLKAQILSVQYLWKKCIHPFTISNPRKPLVPPSSQSLPAHRYQLFWNISLLIIFAWSLTLCKWNHTVYILLCMAFFIHHNVEIHQMFCVYQQFIPFYCLIAFHCMNTPQFIFLFSC